MLSQSQRAELAARLRRDRNAHAGRDGEDSRAGRLTRRPAGTDDPPASYGQEQLWFLDQFAPGQTTYNLLCAVRIHGPLDAPALSRAVDGLLARHEVLRTRLVPGAHSRPVQMIDPPPRDVVEALDYRGDDAWSRLTSLAARELAHPFDLAEGPLTRARLVRLAGADHMLLVTVHHAVFDGFSAGVLVGDLAALYTAEVTGEPSGLAELPVQFADYAWWERQRLQGSVLEELEGYWRTTLDGFELLRLPADRPRPPVDSFEGGQVTTTLGADLLAGLQELSQREGTTLFVTLMAAFQALLFHYTGQTDLVVGTTTANRSRAALEPAIGFLVNTLPIRCDLSGDPPFTHVLARVREATVGAYAHQELPFGKIVEALRVERDASRAPITQLTFNLAGIPHVSVTAAQATFVLAGKLVDADRAKFDLDMLAEARDDGLWLEATYTSALFDDRTIRRLLRHFEVLLRGVIADPSTRLSALPVLTAAERHDELTGWNDTARDFPVTTVHRAFEAQVSQTPDATAAEFEGESVSYAELNRRAGQIAQRLRAAGIGPESLVAVCLPASLRLLSALLGIWKAGGAYVPLDPALPAGRMSFMLADSGAALLLTDDSALAAGGALAGLAPGPVTVLSLDAEQPAISAVDGAGPAQPAATADNAAYVIYTSGSTGQPKGVVVEHRQVSNFLQAQIDRWQVGPADVVLMSHSLNFDASVQDLYMPLVCGARTILAADETLRSPHRLAALINSRGVTCMLTTPAALSVLGDRDFPRLRLLSLGGEVFPAELARRWIRPGLQLSNEYGPTEATVTALSMAVDDTTPLPPPIGVPLANYQAYVLDPYLNPVPAGITGELYIGGAGVARGYLNRPELTRERFIPDPFRAQDFPGRKDALRPAKLYKTGDLVRRRADGTIVFLGRADHQVKVHGLRIELGEIEAALAAHPAVAQAVVTVVTSPAGDRQLAGYVRPEPACPPGDPSPAELRAFLAETLPAYMIPAHLITVETFPVNPSGKIDRHALPAPGHQDTGREHVAPATCLETVLSGLYATVLQSGPVGATDSFFARGGSSLQVMRLVDLISQELGVDIGVSAVFLNPAPRQLADRIEAIRTGLTQPDGAGPLLELAHGVGDLPLFLIHPIGGTVFAYTPLACELAGTFKVYGLEAPALTQRTGTAGSLDALADDYTQRIRAIQPSGPYRLAGWSMGGVIAFEVALRLEQADAEVASLILLDAPFAGPDAAPPAPGEARLAAQFVADAARSLGWDAADLPDPATATTAGQLAWLAARLGGQDAASRQSATAQLQARFDVFRAHTAMVAGYRPQSSGLRAPTLIVSADGSPNAPARQRWPRVVAGPVATQAVPGGHYDFLRPPLVAEVAASILKWHDGSA